MNTITLSLRDKEIKKYKADRNFYVVMATVVFLVLVYVLLNTYVYFGIKVVGNSMNPTLKNGDVLTASYIAEPDYGSVVVVKGKLSEEDASKWLIKRIIGKPGDVVEIKGGYVYLTKQGGEQEKLENESYVMDNGKTYAFGGKSKWVLGENEYFFLGDNRENSSDSRIFGTCSRQEIVGVVTNWSISVKGIKTALYYIPSQIASIFR